ncbi:MAG TPA: biopolymer transporter ExbD [Gemmatimonadaceae bacterium]
MRRRRSGRLQLNAEINVVSLIDVMMLLLVIFMITAPMMQGGVDIKLPVAVARPLESKSSMVITVDRDGNVFVGRDRMTYSQFRTAFKAMARDAVERGAYVQADSRATVEMFMRVLAVVREAGVTNLGVAVEPEPPR